MSIKHSLAIVLLATAATLTHSPAHAADGAKKDPKTGKSCVVFFSAQKTTTGQTQMNFRNICANAFEIRIQAGEDERKKSIEAGSPESPSKVSIICKVDDRCENAKWVYE